jgi:hypothetical protein
MPGNQKPNAASLPVGFLVVLAGSVLAWLVLGLPSTGIDDADIFLVYARNLAQGHGFAYNIGERVEGFTSMLWVLICSGLFRLFHAFEAPLVLMNLLFGTIALTACLRRLKTFSLFLLLIAAAPAWFAWSHLTLMETGLWGMLLTLLVLAVAERRGEAVALLVPFMVLTRPESMLWCPWAMLVLGIGTAAQEGWRQGLKTITLPLVNFLVALTGLLLFRLTYFGYPVPNTYYAKVSPDFVANLRSGLDYLYRYLISNPVVFLVVGTWGAVLAGGLHRRRVDRSLLVALCLLPGLGIPVLVGGDHFGSFRFYQPVWPLLCLLAAWELSSWMERFIPRVRRWIPGALFVIGWILFALPDPYHLKNEFRIAREGRATGAALKELSSELDPAPAVAVITAGGVKYTYPGKVLDLMGLNAIEMAHATGSRTGVKNHSAFNREVFYRWHPDILLCGDSAEFDSKVLKGLHREKEFDRRYAKGTLHRQDAAVTAYFSRRFLSTLPDAHFEPSDSRSM